MRAAFVRKIEEMMPSHPNIFMLTADLGRFFDSFKENYPDNFMNCGVAEENMVGIAGGMAWAGKKVYCYSIVPFLILRAMESIKVNVCLDKQNVILLGGGGGLVYGKDGITHQSIEDIACMRGLPSMTIVAPGDLIEAEAIAKASLDFEGPLYIRFGRDNAPQVHKNKLDNFKIGKGIILNKGRKVALIVSGSLLYEADEARKILQEDEKNITLVSMPTIKPIDRDLIRDLAQTHAFIFTLEDHNVIGGLGSAVQDVLNDLNYKGKLTKIGVPDEYPKNVGSMNYLYSCYGFEPVSIASKIVSTVEQTVQHSVLNS
ncbi:MAG: transketolase C-terminal domain-containing protein [bacterium]|nr:transketolase C-terminal domain-containing protein [bacterium]